jgi:hypothetical protein
MTKIWVLDNEDIAHLIELDEDIQQIPEDLIRQIEQDLCIEIVDYWFNDAI